MEELKEKLLSEIEGFRKLGHKFYNGGNVYDGF